MSNRTSKHITHACLSIELSCELDPRSHIWLSAMYSPRLAQQIPSRRSSHSVWLARLVAPITKLTLLRRFHLGFRLLSLHISDRYVGLRQSHRLRLNAACQSLGVPSINRCIKHLYNSFFTQTQYAVSSHRSLVNRIALGSSSSCCTMLSGCVTQLHQTSSARHGNCFCSNLNGSMRHSVDVRLLCGSWWTCPFLLLSF